MPTSSHVTVGVLVSLFALVVDACGQHLFKCSSKIVQEFAFGAPFKSDVARIINERFVNEQQCAELSAYLQQEVKRYFGQDSCTWTKANKMIPQIGNLIIRQVHYRVGKAPAAAPSDAQKRIEDLLKLNLFDDAVFEEVTPSSCAGKVQLALEMWQPFNAKLANYLDGFNRSACVLFEKKIKAIFRQTIANSNVEWFLLPEEPKCIAVQGFFNLLYAFSAKLPSTATKEDQIVAGLAYNDVIRENICDKAASGSMWRIIFWPTLAVAVIIVSAIGLYIVIVMYLELPDNE